MAEKILTALSMNKLSRRKKLLFIFSSVSLEIFLPMFKIFIDIIGFFNNNLMKKSRGDFCEW